MTKILPPQTTDKAIKEVSPSQIKQDLHVNDRGSDMMEGTMNKKS